MLPPSVVALLSTPLIRCLLEPYVVVFTARMLFLVMLW